MKKNLHVEDNINQIKQNLMLNRPIMNNLYQKNHNHSTLAKRNMLISQIHQNFMIKHNITKNI